MVRMIHDAWLRQAEEATAESLLAAAHSPARFQRELVDFMVGRVGARSPIACLEVGSASGVTSSCLPASWSRNLMDLCPAALEKGKELFDALGQHVTCIAADILDLPARLGTYDVVFSAGLIEHFDPAERTRAVLNLLALTRPEGHLFAAIPNHLCLPYRVAYEYRQWRGTWWYPPEHRVRDLEREMAGAPDAVLQEIVSLDCEDIYHHLPRLLKPVFRLLGAVIQFEGYLRVIYYRRTGVSAP